MLEISFSICAGIFSDVLNYVLRISKLSSLSSTSFADAADETEVKPKDGSKHGLRRRIAVHSDDDEERNDIATVCVECFTFLKTLARDYKEVQER